MKTILILFTISCWLWGSVAAQDQFDASHKKQYKAATPKDKLPVRDVEVVSNALGKIDQK